MTTYTLYITEKQARTIGHACEVLARLGMGQFREALECLPLREAVPDGWHEDMEGIAHILKKHTTIMHGVGAYHSIGSHKTSDTSKTAWDIYQVVRHRLAWDATPEGDPMSVMFDEPMRTSTEPLAWIERDEKLDKRSGHDNKKEAIAAIKEVLKP
jgi:hypothetical protein